MYGVRSTYRTYDTYILHTPYNYAASVWIYEDLGPIIVRITEACTREVAGDPGLCLIDTCGSYRVVTPYMMICTVPPSLDALDWCSPHLVIPTYLHVLRHTVGTYTLGIYPTKCPCMLNIHESLHPMLNGIMFLEEKNSEQGTCTEYILYVRHDMYIYHVQPDKYKRRCSSVCTV